MSSSDEEFHRAYFNKEMTGLWNLSATIGNDSLKLREASKAVSTCVEESVRQLDEAYKSLEKARAFVYATKRENERLRQENQRLVEENKVLNGLGLAYVEGLPKINPMKMHIESHKATKLFSDFIEQIEKEALDASKKAQP